MEKKDKKDCGCGCDGFPLKTKESKKESSEKPKKENK